MLNLTQRLEMLIALGLALACLSCGVVERSSSRSLRQGQDAQQHEPLKVIPREMPEIPTRPQVSPSQSSAPPAVVALNALSFLSDIRPIIVEKCSECHHAGGRLTNLTAFPFNEGDMDGYVDYLLTVANPSTSPRMPPGPRAKLTNVEYQKIVQWQGDGLHP